MKKLTKPQLWLIGISLGAFIAILLVPTTRLYAMLDLQQALLPPSLVTASHLGSAKDTYIAKHPDDYELQIAAIPSQMVESSDTAGTPTAADLSNIKVLDNLIAKFPNQPAVYAYALRYESRYFIHNIEWKAKENADGGYPSVPKLDPPAPLGDKAVMLQDFVRQCQAGQALEPNNAYFPLMLASAYYSLHKDDLAQETLIGSAKCTGWNEYITDEVQGSIRSTIGAQGGIDALGEVAIVASTLFPQYAQMRSMTRMASWEASQEEANGNFARGIAVRHGLMHCGSLMRVKGSSIICNLVGIAITWIAVSRPEELPPLQSDKSVPIPQQVQDLMNRREALYANFLVEHGQAAEAEWAKQELTSALATKAEISSTMSAYENSIMRGLIIYGILMAGSIAAMIWMLIALCLGGLTASATGVVEYVKLRQFNKDMLTLTIVMVASVALTLNILLHASSWTSGYSVVSSLNGQDSDQNSTLIIATCTAFAITPFLIFSIVVAIVAAVRKRPVIGTVIKTSLAWATPTVCGLLIAFCVTLVLVVRQDSIIRETMQSEQQIGEGQYIASLYGKQWPGLNPKAPQTLSAAAPTNPRQL